MHNSKLNKKISGKAYEGRSHFLYMRYMRLLNTNKYYDLAYQANKLAAYM